MLSGHLAVGQVGTVGLKLESVSCFWCVMNDRVVLVFIQRSHVYLDRSEVSGSASYAGSCRREVVMNGGGGRR